MTWNMWGGREKGVTPLKEAVRNSQDTIGTTSVFLSAAKKRKAIVMKNMSLGGQTITLKFDQGVAIAGEGIVLAAGESITDTDSAGSTCYDGDINAISDIAGALLSVFERSVA